MYKRAYVFKALLGASLATVPVMAHSYELPVAQGPDKSEAVAELQKLSNGVSAITAQARGAIVFVSVTKTAERPSFQDPFDFFFGVPSPERRQEPAPKQQGVGSGFIVDMEKGYIVTNNHVIEGANEIELRLANEQIVKGKVIGRDANTDIAVIQIKNFKKDGLTHLTFGNSDAMRIGELSLALGAPFGLEASASFGIVSAIGRGSLGITELGDFIQTDAAINPGNSGGPLLNTSGQVIGVNTAIFSQSGAYAGIGFAIPSNMARLVANRLINHGHIERGYIGAALQQITEDLSQDLKLPANITGALVANIIENGPAAKAGLQPGDVVTQVNGRDIRSSSELVNTVGLMEPGVKVQLTVFREGKKRNIEVTLGRWPGKPGLAGQQSGDHQNQSGGPLGLSLAPLTDAARERYALSSRHGALVTNVKVDSAAARAGLRPGDLIVMANQQRIEKPADLVKQAEGKKRLLMRIERQGQFFFVSIMPKGSEDRGVN